MPGVIRMEALKGLRAQLAAAIPDLEYQIRAGQAPPNTPRKFPCLNIYPTRWTYDPSQEAEVLDPGADAPADDRLILNVGEFTATIQLRLSTATLDQRDSFEDKILNVFLSQEGRPGILITPVSSMPELGNWVAAWELEGDEWNDAKAFDNEFDSIIEVTGIIPALVNRAGVFRMDEIRLGFTEKFPDPDFNATTFDTSPDIERTRIDEDGIAPIT